MQIVNDVLTNEESRQLEDLLFGARFPWNWCPRIISTDPNSRSQFTHTFYQYGQPQSEHYHDYVIQRLITKLNAAALIKIKANMQQKTDEIVEHQAHIDHQFPNAKTAIYYVNTCNGYTCWDTPHVYDNATVTWSNSKRFSNRNTMAIFDSELQHFGTTCTDAAARCVINFNYFPAQ